MASSVKVTLGPVGRNVIIEKKVGCPLIINDGVTIAKEVELEDPIENMGAKMLYEVAKKTNISVGDGTTTAIVLAYNMICKGIEKIKEGYNPVFLKEGMKEVCREICDYLELYSKKIETIEDVENIATISSGSNKIGKLISEAIAKVGKEGIINISKSKSYESKLELVNGIEYNKGVISPYMIDEGKKEVILEDAYILVTNNKIDNIEEIISILEFVMSEHKPLLMIADDFSSDVIDTLIINKINGTLNVVATLAPSFGESRNELLSDISILTSSFFFNKELNCELKNIKPDDLGWAKKIVISREKTIIIDGKKNEVLYQGLLKSLKNQISSLEIDEYIEKYCNRLARITESVAVIHVGGVTEVELEESRLRVEDAVNATKAAISEGVITGGGASLCKIYNVLKKELYNENNDIQSGMNIVIDSLLSPLWQIAENSGYNGDDVLEKQLLFNDNTGFDARSGKWVNMYKEGIIDPKKVTKNAIINAVSVASLFLTTEVTISYKNKKEIKEPIYDL